MCQAGALIAFVLVLPLASGCWSGQGADAAKRFTMLTPEASGVTFANTLAETADLNILNYLYYFNGGGVAAGDVNGDGWTDLFFTSNEGPNRLYLNRGGMRFEDVTDVAGVAGRADWSTGVTMADVNADGFLDIYVSVVAGVLGLEGRNELYINDGTGRFTEQAAAYGLDHRGYGTQAAFFDYDRDGDLDVYLLNHSAHTERTLGRAELREERHPLAGDRLLRNEASPDGGRPTFVDVSEEAGIYGSRIGYGLAVAVSDVDDDGWADLYVSNDFHENDYLYVNNGDGTFRETIYEATGHTSYFSMGSDAADFNNDGAIDLAVLDMRPAREDILKTSEGIGAYDTYQLRHRFGFHHQFGRNTLQLNRGDGRFSEVAYLAGVAATDWSWASLLADLDNDGWKDLYVTNGIYRRPNDLDYINFVSNEAIQQSLEAGITEENLELMERMPTVPMPNAAFRNRGDLTFEDAAAAWGLALEGFSNGAVYADLDNDGDLDLAVNNVNAPATLYRNETRAPDADGSDRRYLQVVLEGAPLNPFGVGARIWAWTGGQVQVADAMPTRGWQSAVEPRLHLGLGAHTQVDSLRVRWPDGREEVRTRVAADQRLALRYADASAVPRRSKAQAALFTAADAASPAWRHQENTFIDFNRERLSPHFRSTEGPALAVGDVDGDGLNDLFVGGAKWQPASLWRQTPDGRFEPTGAAPWRADSLHEDVNAAFFDADGDADLDLLVVSGGNEFWGEAEALRDRLYLNDGAGRFVRDRDALPPLFENGGPAAIADFDADGDLDVFIGGRVVASHYGAHPRSALLRNDGTGRFEDVTAEAASFLERIGMVAGAAWADVDGDGRLDLTLAGEWMPLTIVRQTADGRFEDGTAAAGLDGTSGWWHSLAATDLDGDGDVDLVGGNLGLNSDLRATPDEPLRLYLDDFDGNGSPDPLLTQYRHGTAYPHASRNELLQQLQPLRKAYVTYESFGGATVADLVDPDQLAGAEQREAGQMASVVAWNEGGRFVVQPLPMEAQFAPVYAIAAADLNADGRSDLILAGNFDGVTPRRGRYDANPGTILLQAESGWSVVPWTQTGLDLDAEVRQLAWLDGPASTNRLVAAQNDGPIRVFTRNDSGRGAE